MEATQESVRRLKSPKLRSYCLEKDAVFGDFVNSVVGIHIVLQM